MSGTGQLPRLPPLGQMKGQRRVPLPQMDNGDAFLTSRFAQYAQLVEVRGVLSAYPLGTKGKGQKACITLQVRKNTALCEVSVKILALCEVFYMSLKVKEIEEEALRLPSHERAQLAERLIHSLDEEDPEAEKLWVEEAERRYRAYKEGKVKTKSANLVFKEARSKFK